jgi:hypothetical protein
MKIATKVIEAAASLPDSQIDTLCTLFADTRGCDQLSGGQRARIIMRCMMSTDADRRATWTFFAKAGIPATRIRTRA